MTIRLMTLDDYAAVYALWLSCQGMGLNNVDDSEAGIRRYLARNPDTCFVAEENGQRIVVIVFGIDGRPGFIHHTAVSPVCRHRGIARQLVQRATEALAALGITKVALVVFERNEAGNAFWEKQGFTVRQDLMYRNKALMEMERIDT